MQKAQSSMLFLYHNTTDEAYGMELGHDETQI